MFILYSVLILLAYSIYESRRSRKYAESLIEKMNRDFYYKKYIRISQSKASDFTCSCGLKLSNFHFDENLVAVFNCECGKQYVLTWD